MRANSSIKNPLEPYSRINSLARKTSKRQACPKMKNKPSSKKNTIPKRKDMDSKSNTSVNVQRLLGSDNCTLTQILENIPSHLPIDNCVDLESLVEHNTASLIDMCLLKRLRLIGYYYKNLILSCTSKKKNIVDNIRMLHFNTDLLKCLTSQYIKNQPPLKRAEIRFKESSLSRRLLVIDMDETLLHTIIKKEYFRGSFQVSETNYVFR